MTALWIGCWTLHEAHAASSLRSKAEISGGVNWRSPSITVSLLPILRLMLRTVRSGYSTNWLRAGSPTNSSPEGESPTTEGNMLFVPKPRTCTWPSTKVATSEFVVPRSMPTIRSLILALSLLLCSLPWGAGYFDLSRTINFTFPLVTAAVNVNYRPLGHRVGLFQFHRGQPVRIENMSLTKNWTEMVILQRLIEAVQGEGIAFLQRR